MRLLGWIGALSLLVLAAQTATLSVVRQAEPQQGLLIVQPRDPAGGHNPDLYLITPLGEIVRRLTDIQTTPHPVSLNGAWLYFRAEDGLHRVQVWDGWEASHQLLLPATVGQYHKLIGWLPDGATMLLAVLLGSWPNETCGLAVMQGDGSGYRVLDHTETLHPVVCGFSTTIEARWSPNCEGATTVGPMPPVELAWHNGVLLVGAWSGALLIGIVLGRVRR